MNIELNEEAEQYLNSLSHEDKEAIYRQLQNPKKESLDSLAERLSELNKQPVHNRDEKRKILAEMDERMDWEREKQLALFINAEIEKGGAVDASAIKRRAKALGILGDLTPHINRVVELRQTFLRKDDE